MADSPPHPLRTLTDPAGAFALEPQLLVAHRRVVLDALLVAGDPARLGVLVALGDQLIDAAEKRLTEAGAAGVVSHRPMTR